MVKTVQEKQDLARAMRHVIVESGIVPGIDTHYRCDECRTVTISMDNAGYLDRVQKRWAESENAVN